MWRRRRIQKSTNKPLRKILFILILLIIIGIVFLLLKAPFVSINQIEIKANNLECADSDQLKSATSLLGQNFFVFDEKKVKKSLSAKFVCIRDVNLTRSFPNKVSVAVESRNPVLTFASLKEKLASTSSLIENIATPSAEDITDYFVVDNEGIIFTKNTENLNIPKVYLYNPGLAIGGKLRGELIVSILKILVKFKTLGVTYKDSWLSDDVFLVNSEVPKLKIVFRLNGQLDVQLASLQLILAEAKINEKQLEFIDLRFDKPIAKFAPKK